MPVSFLNSAIEPVHDAVVDVVAAEVRVAVGRDDLDDLLADLEHRDVERAAAEVVDGDQVLLALVEAVGERGRGRLVDDALDVEAGDAARVLGRLALRVVEVRRHGDDRLGDLLAEVLLGGALELARGCAPRSPAASSACRGSRSPRRRSARATTLYGTRLVSSCDLVELAAHEALDREDGVLGIGDRLAAGDLADQDLALVVEGDHRRGQASAFLVGDDLGLLALHDRDDGVGGAQVDADDLAHCSCASVIGRQPNHRRRGVK